MPKSYTRDGADVVTVASDDVRLDGTTTAVKAIDSAHHEIHDGNAYEISMGQDIDASANLDLLIVTPDTTKWAHMFMQADTEAEAMLYVYQDTNSTGGVAITPINKNRNSSNASGLTITSGPTVTAVGDQIRIAKSGSGNKVGGFTRGVGEIILRQNTKYLFRITNEIAQAKWVSQQFTWYEHTNL